MLIILLINIYSCFIINIDILTNNKNIQSLISNELDKLEIKKYTLFKTSSKLNDIKKIIQEKNKDTIEWLNIERIGMKYVINLEPKIVKNKKEEQEYCNIISNKDAVITRIITSSGAELKEVNDSVKKGEILISGDITYNNETKSQICANGEVYGKTWYTISVSVPKTYEKQIIQNKKRNNISIKHDNKEYKIFKSRLDTFKTAKKKIFNLFGFEFYLNIENEVEKKSTEYTEDEITNLIKKQVENKMGKTLSGDYQILEQKVLKKIDNNSTIDIDIFIVAEEKISTISYEVLKEE